ncbi:response regulator [Natrinema marinum]|uniref:response regulator n=1 Tax=Natrinema marinum TaxID=2961598 RepID=UPI0020C885FC|nr:response regulator [Natrinema marinum]
MTRDHGIDPADILLIEDNPGDIHLIREALEKGSTDGSVPVITDGAEALDYVDRWDDAGSAPAVVVLDLNLPKVDGKTILEAIRADPALRSVPVVVFSSSESAEDIRETNHRGADGYHVKPVDPNEYIALVRAIAASVSDTGRPPPGAYSTTDPIE